MFCPNDIPRKIYHEIKNELDRFNLAVTVSRFHEVGVRIRVTRSNIDLRESYKKVTGMDMPNNFQFSVKKTNALDFFEGAALEMVNEIIRISQPEYWRSQHPSFADRYEQDWGIHITVPTTFQYKF